MRRVDKKLEDALLATAKNSLLDLSRAINGDARSEPTPIFTVTVILDASQKIEFSPTIISLTQMVNIVSKKMLQTLKCVPRIISAKEAGNRANVALNNLKSNEEGAANNGNDNDGTADDGAAAGDNNNGDSSAVEGAISRKGSMKTYYDMISEDEDILKVLVKIMNGMSSSGAELHKVLSHWDQYRLLWEMDKDAYIRRYAKANKPLSTYEADIQRYRDRQLDVQNEDVSDNISFIEVDYAKLKEMLTAHAIDWQSRLTSLLNANAKEELDSLLCGRACPFH